MDNQQSQLEDEINLRDYINVIIKRKKLILAIFLVSVITTAIVSIMMPKVYQATAFIMIVPSKIQTALSPTPPVSFDVQQKTGTGEYLGQGLAISLPTHKALLKSNVVLERIIDRLKLTDAAGKTLTPDDLFKRLNIKETKETNILQLEAEGNNPKKAQELANAWTQEYITYSQEFISGDVKGTGDFITDQFAIAKQNLTQAEEKVKDFKDKYKIDLMQAELDIKKGELNNYKKELMELEMTLKTKGDNLAELKKEILKQDKFIIVSKAITDDALWQNEDKEKTSVDLDKKKLRSEEVNPIYRDLETRKVNTEIEINTTKPRLEYFKKSVGLIEAEINDSEKIINQREFELTQLNRQVDIYKRTYDNLSNKTEEARIAKAAQLGEVKLVSPANEPKYPIKPNKRNEVAISGIISLMFGIFLAFFMEYWEKSKQTETSKIKP